MTIADYAADLRAGTPSIGAERAVPDQKAERARLEQLHRRLALALRSRLALTRRELDRLRGSRALRNIKTPVQDRQQALDSLLRRMGLALRNETDRGRQALDAQKKRLPLALKSRVLRQRGWLARLASGLDAMSPLKVLGRGYAIARRDGKAVTLIEQVEPGDELEVLVSNGTLNCAVGGKEERSWR